MDAKQLLSLARQARRTSLSEASGKCLLTYYGVQVPASVIVQAHEPMAQRLAALRPPLVAKVMSPGILHKSDVGGVRVGLASSAEAEAAIAAMLATPAISSQPLDGFLVEEMAPRGQEMVVGALKDPQFGPLIMVGLGGIFVEVLKDVSFRICPIDRVDALEMISELRGKALLDGARGNRPVSREALIDVLLKLGGVNGLLLELADDIAEVDLNPLIVSERGAMAADARFILTEKAPA